MDPSQKSDQFQVLQRGHEAKAAPTQEPDAPSVVEVLSSAGSQGSNASNAGASSRQNIAQFSKPQVAQFLVRTYRMVDDPATDNFVRWSDDGKSFIVEREPAFSYEVLPNYYRHNKFSSFVRQLNLYNFSKKSTADRMSEFYNPYFQRGREDLLHNIKRKLSGNKSQINRQVIERLQSQVDQLQREYRHVRDTQVHMVNFLSSILRLARDDQGRLLSDVYPELKQLERVGASRVPALTFNDGSKPPVAASAATNSSLHQQNPSHSASSAYSNIHTSTLAAAKAASAGKRGRVVTPGVTEVDLESLRLVNQGKRRRVGNATSVASSTRHSPSRAPQGEAPTVGFTSPSTATAGYGLPSGSKATASAQSSTAFISDGILQTPRHNHSSSNPPSWKASAEMQPTPIYTDRVSLSGHDLDDLRDIENSIKGLPRMQSDGILLPKPVSAAVPLASSPPVQMHEFTSAHTSPDVPEPSGTAIPPISPPQHSIMTPRPDIHN